MKNGIILGKFDMMHKGHEALINFAKDRCDILHILLCMNKEEEITSGEIRLKWLLDTYKNDDKIIVKYTEKKLPYTSKSDRHISKLWADHIKEILPNINIIFTSEPYGDYVAEYLGIEHIMFDQSRNIVPITATMIRNNPIKYWDYISDAAKPCFVKKICICGTESTGKTILTEKLAKYFNTNYVKEWGRLMVRKSEEVTINDIMNIGEIHAEDILEKINYSNKILFSDTDLNTTKTYSKFFFDMVPIFEDWIEKANTFDLYLFLEKDAPYIQDGTRLSKEKRDELGNYHYNYLISKKLNIQKIIGTEWNLRTKMAIDIIEKNFFNF